MGRFPSREKQGVKKGPWTPEEDIILVSYIQENGPGNWNAVPTNTGLMRCSKSCRLRWTNYLNPGIKRGNFTEKEERTIIRLQALLGNRWAAIASYLPQRTDNDIKSYWKTHIKKKLEKLPTVAGVGHDGSSGSSNTKGQWERKLQNDINTAKQALQEAISDLPSATFSTHHQTQPYASNANNIARLLESWTTDKPKPMSGFADVRCGSTSSAGAMSDGSMTGGYAPFSTLEKLEMLPTVAGVGHDGSSGSSNTKGQWEQMLQNDINTAKQALQEAISDSPSATFSTHHQTQPYASNANNIARLLESWTTDKPKPMSGFADVRCGSTSSAGAMSDGSMTGGYAPFSTLEKLPTVAGVGHDGSSGSSNTKGQWEQMLQNDINAAKQALQEAISDSPSATFSTHHQTQPYASNANNIARLLESWSTDKPKTMSGFAYVRCGSTSSAGAMSDGSMTGGYAPIPTLEKWLFDDNGGNDGSLHKEDEDNSLLYEIPAMFGQTKQV